MNLQEFEVKEISRNEAKNINGGSFLLGLAVGALVGLIVGLLVVSDGECPDCE
ncbi:MAG: hypothetical protein ABFS35_20875 [Bacteroidota bacterium]